MGLLLVAECVGCGSRSRPSDAILIRQLQEHLRALETLARELQADREIAVVYPTSIIRHAAPEIWVSSDKLPQSLRQRWSRYAALMRDAGIGVRAACLKEGCFAVEFVVFAEGYLDSGSSKGFLYSKTAPAPLVESLDHPEWPSASRDRRHYTGYRHVRDSWYLWSSY